MLVQLIASIASYLLLDHSSDPLLLNTADGVSPYFSIQLHSATDNFDLVSEASFRSFYLHRQSRWLASDLAGRMRGLGWCEPRGQIYGLDALSAQASLSD